MKANLYSFVTAYSRGLDTAAHLLAKAEEHATAQGVSEADMLDWRLAPDMFNLRQQIQTVVRFAGSWSARAAGTEIPADPEGLQSLADLRRGIAETKAQLAAFKPEQFDGRDEVTLAVNIGGMEPTFAIAQWLPGFATPNYYFHLSMAYAILRQHGVVLGKRDFFAGGL